MARRSKHTQEQIKELVLDAAERIIVDEGIEGLTVRKIALEIGYTVGSIYMVFANMQELIRQVSARSLGHLSGRLQSLPDAGSTEQQILAIALSYLDFAIVEFNRWRIIFCRDLPREPLPDWYADRIQAIFEPIEALFRQLSPERPEEQIRLAARTLWCAVHGVCMLSLHGGLDCAGSEDCKRAVRLLVENFIEGWKQALSVGHAPH
ncbi:MAG: TetR/AcrR family transcriptional regulator [Methylococcales bacterium]|nr:TetR/AcrR family transcriptional regulator [Methylococcales bacterium]